MGDLNLPFEPQPPVDVDLDGAFLSAGVVAMAAVIPSPDGRPIPAVVLRFAMADGSGFANPVVVATDTPATLLQLSSLIGQAARAAIAAAGA